MKRLYTNVKRSIYIRWGDVFDITTGLCMVAGVAAFLIWIF